MTGLVFRRLRSPSEREAAGRLLADIGVPPVTIRSAGDPVLYGLWDLAGMAHSLIVPNPPEGGRAGRRGRHTTA